MYAAAPRRITHENPLYGFGMDLNTLPAKQALTLSVACQKTDPDLSAALARHASAAAKTAGQDFTDLVRDVVEVGFPDFTDETPEHQVFGQALKSVMAEGLTLPLTMTTAQSDIKTAGERAETLVAQYKSAIADIASDERILFDETDEIRNTIAMLEELSRVGKDLSDKISETLKSRLVDTLTVLRADSAPSGADNPFTAVWKDLRES